LVASSPPLSSSDLSPPGDSNPLNSGLTSGGCTVGTSLDCNPEIPVKNGVKFNNVEFLQNMSGINPQECDLKRVFPSEDLIESVNSSRISDSGSNVEVSDDSEVRSDESSSVHVLMSSLSDICECVISESGSGGIKMDCSGSGNGQAPISSNSTALSSLNVLNSSLYCDATNGASHCDSSSHKTYDALLTQSDSVDTTSHYNHCNTRLNTHAVDALLRCDDVELMRSRALSTLRDNTPNLMTPQNTSNLQMSVLDVPPKRGDENVMLTDCKAATINDTKLTRTKRNYNEVIDLTADEPSEKHTAAKRTRDDSVSTVQPTTADTELVAAQNVQTKLFDITVTDTPSNTYPPFTFPGYDGQFNALGERHGEGLMDYWITIGTSATTNREGTEREGGGVYVGMWASGMRCGEGVMEYPNGE
jgi:hypothetical protein